MTETVVIGLLGTRLDAGKGARRWERWRPTVSLVQQEGLSVARLELLAPTSYRQLADRVGDDVRRLSPDTEVRHHPMDFEDPWDLEEVWGKLFELARGYPFDTDAEDYLVHITTGTHVAQICMFLLTEARYLPGRLIQTAPDRENKARGRHSIIDLDLSRYDRIAARFEEEQQSALTFLKSGIETRNAAFNRLMERIERVVLATEDPVLLTGPTGAGKTLLARRIYELKHGRRLVSGRFVEVNCATLRGDGAMSALFGHVRGAFTGATSDRPGLLRAADGGMLFLDEIGELGADEQAMLLRAIEAKVFLPVGSDREVASDFQLIAGTNRDLRLDVAEGRFREDLLARIDLWTFELPGLKDRLEDLEPNLSYELEAFAERRGRRISLSREARRRFLSFATGPDAAWAGNFRDLNAAVIRMGTLARGGRITESEVDEEIDRLRGAWRAGETRSTDEATLEALIGPDRYAVLDRFDRVQLADVLVVCLQSRTLSEAGRRLFAVSRTRRTTTNDADRLRKYLARHDLSWKAIDDFRKAR